MSAVSCVGGAEALWIKFASSHDEEQEKERRPLVVILYVAGMSEDIRRVCRKFNSL